jgi:hypothetical protein
MKNRENRAKANERKILSAAAYVVYAVYAVYAVSSS